MLPAQLQAFYLILAFGIQLLLIANFAARNLRPTLEQRYGGIVYAASGLPALALGILLLVSRADWYFAAGPLLTALHAGCGTLVDRVQRVPWRSPPRWGVLIPYLSLFIGGQLLFWISLWYVGIAFWIAYGVLYGINTTLNLLSHRRKRSVASWT